MMNNRDISWLMFNRRVLQEAQDEKVPLIQRLRFLGIYSNNLDEFIRVRLARIIRRAQVEKSKLPPLTERNTSTQLLSVINFQISESQKEFIDIYKNTLNEMREQNIYILNGNELSEKQIKYCHKYFVYHIKPYIYPKLIKNITEFSTIVNDNLNFGVKIIDCKKDKINYAVFEIPLSLNLPRFLVLSSNSDKVEVIFIDDIIRLFVDEVFFMFKYDKISIYEFRVLRDARLNLNNEASKEPVIRLKSSLKYRLSGKAVSLVYEEGMPDDLLRIITSKLNLEKRENSLSRGRNLMLQDLMEFPTVKPDLECMSLEPLRHPLLEPLSSILEIIEEQDVFLNYPYHTFDHFLDFLYEASVDSKVESIYITLYRSAKHSKVIDILINAAKSGKSVVVYIELLARFDEEQNIYYSELLQKNGVTVIQVIEGLKVHSKLVLIDKKRKSYVYVGTGNFNESTAKTYCDFGLFTSKPQIIKDAKTVFSFLMNTNSQLKCEYLLVSPSYMRGDFEKLIKREIKNAEEGKSAYIHAKFNSLTDKRIINLLYKASEAGVEIHLIVRGACCLQPQVKGLSDNIWVISIVDRYLEHARMAIFCNNGNEDMYIMSADWMPRNLDKRVEVGLPIMDDGIKDTLRDIFDIQWSDNVKARDMNNTYVNRGNGTLCQSQIVLYDYYRNKNK